ncbi:MAG: hypothetical protein A2W93_09370 [Bacteroidetes bacterium GWF2_43_63]|nr:MAG: hypothetical protein A2W94_05755 [Bacteroidetes bacterium GWE2_42_42]OFY54505.1 MAG: hypothetical protein A2W93_09370 [Bacteroidetes bacterium GWF2_43_63]HBG70455.1 hypothetical protein [Bacteroidales bacterium]HCB63427.1 hypothetical protein [Bacteroidales bacterium]
MNRFKFIKEFLNLSKTEKAGIWLLISIFITVILLSSFLRSAKTSVADTDFSQFEQQILAWESSICSDDKQYNNIKSDLDAPGYSSAKSKLNPFAFNPNELDADGWKRLGLTDKQTKSILNYRQKGGEFRIKKDFAKMYTISEEEYLVLEPFIQLPEKQAQKPDYKASSYEKKEVVRVEINSADTSALMKVRGIGPAFAMRIVSYRSRIHGYISIDQLKEVKGIDSLKFAEISPSLFVNPYLVRKININTVTFDELKGHPYFGYNISLSLINYRKQHGEYKVLTDIKKSALVTEEVYKKISPYLTVQ